VACFFARDHIDHAKGELTVKKMILLLVVFLTKGEMPVKIRVMLLKAKSILPTLLISAAILLLVVVPAMAQAITYTETFHDESLVFPDVTICDEIPAIVTLTYNGVMHVTEFTEDSPNVGTAHARFKMNFEVVVNDAETGELLETARGVKTIFHDNINRQNATSTFNFVSVGRGPVGEHQYHLNGHVNWNANGNPVEFTKVNVHCR
jgi:hypothetical protein